MAITQRSCAHCSTPLPAEADVRRRYCNDTCKAARCTSAAHTDGRYDQWRASTAERNRKSMRVEQCVVCGADFSTKYSGRRFCSNRCGAKASYDSRKQTPEYRALRLGYAQRRRARKRSAGEVEVFASAEIFARDRYRCHRCGTTCKPIAKVPNPLAPTLDHLIPLSKGGAHTRANVATACFQCNSVKGNRGGGEQLAVI